MHGLRYAIRQLLAFATLVACLAGASALASPPKPTCKSSCQCSGTEAESPAVKASALLVCLRRGKNVELDHVRIVGELDLSRLPTTPVGEKPSKRLPGLQAPRNDFALPAIERELATSITGAIVIRARVRIEGSQLEGNLRGGKPTRPLVFLSTFTLRDSIVRGDVDLSGTRFRNPAIFTSTRFLRNVSFWQATFEDNALFEGARVGLEGNFAEARFIKAAKFVDFKGDEGGSASFARARFSAGADFHGSSEGGTVLWAANFSDVVVDGSQVNFQYAVLVDAYFGGDAKLNAGARFKHTKFDGSRAYFRSAQFTGETSFDDSVFSAPATFYGAKFLGEGSVSFDRVTFSKAVDFDQARVSGPLAFVEANALRVTFVDTEFKGSLDFRRAKIAALLLGGGAARARIGGQAWFDNATIGSAMLDNTDFASKASFVATEFGPSATCLSARRPEVIALSIANSSFGSGADFTDARFRGKINFKHPSFEAGKVRWRWEQLSDSLVTEHVVDVREKSGTPGCFEIVAAPQTPQENLTSLAEVLRAIERNFKSLELLDDATDASYAREVVESSKDLQDTNLPWSTKALSRARLYSYGYAGGFGVKPWRILGEIAGLILLGAAAYFFSRKPLGCDPPSDSPVDWKLAGLPVRDVLSYAAGGPARWIIALWVSIAAATSIRTRAAFIGLAASDRLRWFVYFQRVSGYLLMIMLGVSVASTMPVLHKLFSWLPGF